MAGQDHPSAAAAAQGGGGGAGAAADGASHHGFHGLGTSAAFASAGLPPVPPALQLQLGTCVCAGDRFGVYGEGGRKWGCDADRAPPPPLIKSATTTHQPTDPQIKAAIAQGQPVHHLKVLIEEHLKMEVRPCLRVKGASGAVGSK